MRVGIIFVFMDFHRKGRKYRGVLQPLIGPLVAGLLPDDIEIDVVNETWEDPDWDRRYDLLFITGMHSDFDRARQISHYWRRRGAKTVFGGILASTYSQLCRPFFDAVVVGDAEGSVPRIWEDFRAGTLQPVYVSEPYDPAQVPVPRFDLLAGKQHVPLSFEVTRGCPFVCEFCALTGIGTRHHVRPVETVLRDIREGQRMLRGRVPRIKLKIAGFLDNNLGGDLGYLRRLCDALTPLGLHWGTGITHNVVADPDMVQRLSRAGCRAVFMGLESLNPATLSDMRKYQNTVENTRRAIDQCRRHGILIESPLMLSPVTDDLEYIRSIPQRLADCGLHQPTFLCIESPIPGTPHFHRLAAEEEPAFLPDALLRDFNGYTLVTRPKRESVEDFVAGYEWALRHTFTLGGRLRRIRDNVPGFLAHGWWLSALSDLWVHARDSHRPHPRRTYLAGTDVPFPEASSVPLTDADFDSEEERRAILEPWKVTDSAGRVLAPWKRSIRVFERRGGLSEEARGLPLHPPESPELATLVASPFS